MQEKFKNEICKADTQKYGVLLCEEEQQGCDIHTCKVQGSAPLLITLTVLHFSLLACYLLMPYSSDGQTFLGAGQKKKLAGHNDLL